MNAATLVRRLGAARSNAEVRRLVSRSRLPRSVAAVEQLADAVAGLTRVDVAHAARVAEAATLVADATGDAYARGRARRAAGHACALGGDSAGALACYEDAIACFARAGRPHEDAITRSGALQVLIYLGRYEQAFAWAAKAREVFRREQDPLRLARLDTNVANVLHRQDRFAEALALYRRAYRTLTRHGSAQDVAIVLRNIAVCEISLHRFDDALRTHRLAKRQSTRHGLPLLGVQADYNIAYLYQLRGEYGRAVELYDVARRRSARLQDPQRLALCDLDQAELSLDVNRVDEAVTLADRAAAQFDALAMRYEHAKAMAFGAIGRARQGAVREALRRFREARRLFRDEGNRPWLAIIDLYMALVLLDAGEAPRASRLAASALRALSRHGLDAKAASAHLVLARVHLASGALDAARTHGEAADRLLSATQARAVRVQATLVLARTLEAIGETGAAAEGFLRARAQLEAIRTDLRDEDAKIAFLEDKREVYEHAVAVTLAAPAGSPADAFTFAEQAKSRSLSDPIAWRARIQPRAARLPAQVRRLHRLRESLHWTYREIERLETSGGGRPRLDALRADAERLERAVTATVGRVGTADREYASLFSAGTVDLATLQAALPDDGVLLEYFEARGECLVFVISRERLDVVPLGPLAPIRERVTLLRFQLSRPRIGGHAAGAAHTAAAVHAHLQALHARLLAPILDRLDGRRVTIVPHGVLHQLPFHALSDGTRSLTDRATVSYAPSASVYHLCRTKAPVRGGHDLVLGVPDAQAPYIADEVRTVAQVLRRPRVFTGRTARAARLRTEGRGARLIHIAAHGRFRGDDPMLSSLTLADGPVSLTDLYGLDLQADLVTLSGCSTGQSALVAADELLGLVRGCLYAGARSVLVSLWDVNDRTTGELMGSFYRALAGSGDKAAALRQAMQQVQADHPDPYHWAPFVLVGDA